MRSAVLNKVLSYVVQQKDALFDYLHALQSKLDEEGKTNPEFDNPELVYMITQPENSAAVYDWRPFNIFSPDYDNSKLFCQLLQLTLNIDRQERIIALSERLDYHYENIELYKKTLESRSISSEDSLKFKILISIHLKIATQIKSQIEALRLLVSQEGSFVPIDSKKRDANVTGDFLPLTSGNQVVNIPQNRLVLSMRASTNLAFISPSSLVIKEQLKKSNSFTPFANEIMEGGTKQNIVGEEYLGVDLDSAQDISRDSLIAEDGSCARQEYADVPYLDVKAAELLNDTRVLLILTRRALLR